MMTSVASGLLASRSAELLPASGRLSDRTPIPENDLPIF
jgi:hypothetical protein